jgi:hypothetical protein
MHEKLRVTVISAALTAVGGAIYGQYLMYLIRAARICRHDAEPETPCWHIKTGAAADLISDSSAA